MVFGPLLIFSDSSPLVEPNPVISGVARVNFILNKTVMIKNNATNGRTSISENHEDFKQLNTTRGDQLLDVNVPFKMFENNNLIFRKLNEKTWAKSTHRVTETTQFKPEQVQICYIESKPDVDLDISKDSK